MEEQVKARAESNPACTFMNQFPASQFPVQQVTEPDDDFIDLGHLLRVLLRYKWGILGFAFATMLVTGFFVFSMQPVYRAGATIELDSSRANVVNVEELYAVNTNNIGYTTTQFEILKSRSLAERVVRKLELHKHPHFAPNDEDQDEFSIQQWARSLLPARQQEPPEQLTPEEKEERLIQGITSALASRMTVRPVDFSYIVHIGYESTNRQLTSLIVNAVAEEFINSNLEYRLSGTLQATDWLDTRLSELQIKLRGSEEALQDFREQEGLVNIEGVTGLGGNELISLGQRLQEATRARIEAQNVKEDVQGMGNATVEELLTVPAVQRHQAIADVRRDQNAAERRVAELGKRYGPRHPAMQAAQSDLQAANRNLETEVRKVVSGISREYDLAFRNEQQLQANWEARKGEMQDFNRVEFQLQELQREVETNRQLYEIFFTRIKSVSETGGFEKPHARILDRAITPSAPFKPNKQQSLMLAFVLGVILGCSAAILLDVLDNTIKTGDEVGDKLKTNLLGVVPIANQGDHGFISHTWEDPRSQFAESIRSLRTSMLLASVDEPAQVIVVTSTVPGEGKSTIALNLGSALGQMEKTLVIGADLRRPSLAGKCGLPPNHKGLSHFVADTAELDECIRYLDELKIHLMPAGIVPPNPLEMISSRKFMDALAILRDRFDRIVLDSAPVQAVSDPLVLGSYSDALVYVVKADDTAATQARKGIDTILGSNGPVKGVVLNQFNIKRASRYYGKNHYYQYDNYYQPDRAAQRSEPVS
ncbi:MAG: polysaccharide biosynthesis tyrosine autokinase [Pseudomonadota bacterium]